MKRYIQDVWKQFCLMRDLLLAGVLFLGGLYVVGMVIVVVLMSGTEEDSVFLMGSLMVVGALFYMCFFSAAQMVTNYNYAIAMGQTRRQTLPAYMTATWIVYLVFDLAVVLLHWIEQRFLAVIYPGIVQEDVVQPILRWQYLLLIALAGMAVTMLMGAAVTRFGRTAYYVFWVVMLVIVIGLPRGFTYLKQYQSGSALTIALQQMIAYVGAHVRLVLTAGGVIGSVICIIAACLMLRRQQVSI